jgi:hypothetical protein
MEAPVAIANSAGSRLTLIRYVLAALISALCVVNATAVPITYTETATISGSLNGVPFVDLAFTITGSGDTDNITHNLACCFGNRLGASTVTFTLAGFGTGVFTDLVNVAVNQTNTGGILGQPETGISGAGFGDITSNFLILWTIDPAFATWDLSTDIGPLTGPGFCNCEGNPPPFDPIFGISFPTTLGLLHISTPDPTFTAVAAPVPLPATLPLVVAALGALGLVGCSRKRRATAVA